MRFMDAKPDGRAVVYAHIQADPLVVRAADLLAGAGTTQRLLARAAMNGESTDAGRLADDVPDPVRARGARRPATRTATGRRRSSRPRCEVADRGEQTRSQFRGAIVEALAELLLAERTGPRPPGAPHPVRRPPGGDPPVRRDRRARGGPEAWDCKWGARGIKADVLHQLDDARRGAADEGGRLLVGLVVFDARRSCEVRLVREHGPVALDGLRLIALEGLDRLAGRRPA